MSPRKGSASGQATPPIIRIAPRGELNAYVVYEHELDSLALGSPATLALNFSIGLLSVGGTLIVTLATVTITPDRLFYSFLIFCVIFLLAGIYLLLYWWRTHESTRDLVVKIKDRMPPPMGIQEQPGMPAVVPEAEPAPPRTQADPGR